MTRKWTYPNRSPMSTSGPAPSTAYSSGQAAASKGLRHLSRNSDGVSPSGCSDLPDQLAGLLCQLPLPLARSLPQHARVGPPTRRRLPDPEPAGAPAAWAAFRAFADRALVGHPVPDLSPAAASEAPGLALARLAHLVLGHRPLHAHDGPTSSGPGSEPTAVPLAQACRVGGVRQHRLQHCRGEPAGEGSLG